MESNQDQIQIMIHQKTTMYKYLFFYTILTPLMLIIFNTIYFSFYPKGFILPLAIKICFKNIYYLISIFFINFTIPGIFIFNHRKKGFFHCYIMGIIEIIIPIIGFIILDIINKGVKGSYSLKTQGSYINLFFFIIMIYFILLGIINGMFWVDSKTNEKILDKLKNN